MLPTLRPVRMHTPYFATFRVMESNLGHVGLCFHLESAEKNPLGATAVHIDQWRHAAAAFGCTTLAYINAARVELQVQDPLMAISEHESLTAFRSVARGNFVYCESPEAFVVSKTPLSLGEFEHPSDFTWYVFGPVGGLDTNDQEHQTWLSIRQADQPTSVRGLFAHQAAAIILHDRFRQFSVATDS